MTIPSEFRLSALARHGLAILVSSVVSTTVLGAPTELATEPFAHDLTSGTATPSVVPALPNLMFVLDDSGSMSSDFLPDWAGPYRELNGSVMTTVTPPYRFFNSAFNGVAYNPATRYRPPVMYTASGTLDTTTYPSQDGQSAASGGDASATALSPNWRAVKEDGYGVQSTATATAILEGAAFFYTTIAGEYCDSVSLRNCVAASGPTGTHTEAAPLRWCTTAAAAEDTTANAGTNCQASRIVGDTARGITGYTFPRMPRPRTSSVRFSASGTVTSITVGGVEILSAAATGASNVSLVADVVAKVNACTMGITGGCQTLGYMAAVSGLGSDTVTLTAPGATTATPVVTGVATVSISAFSGGNVPGATLFTAITPASVIAPAVASFAYPGSATKGAGRSDCVGTTCTYAEEMTNYANWYAYHRTRMQMMKTSSSIAFSKLDEKFRVGFFSINNGSGSDFLDIGVFDGSQRHAWYSKFFAAKPYGSTPLRTGLATAGRYYAGLLSSINGQTASDPMQYSCQRNYTILSTDGYWNDPSEPVQLDGSTEIGNHDGNDPRPYYDGSTWMRTVTQTTRTDTQIGYTAKVAESMTQQHQQTRTPVNSEVTDTITYDYTQTNLALQKREKALYKTDYSLTATTRPLIETPLVYTKTTQYYTETTNPLSGVSNLLRETSTKVRIQERKVRKVTTNLKKTTYRITITETPLIRSTSKLTETTRKLQARSEVSYNGGDNWSWTSWSDVTGGGATCVAGVLSPYGNSGGVLTREVQCQYVISGSRSDLDTCDQIPQSTGPTYSVQTAVQCQHQNATTEPVTGSHNDAVTVGVSGNHYVKTVTYAYGAAGTPVPGQTSCSLQAQVSAPWVGPARTCAWDSVAYAAETGDVLSGQCAVNNPSDKSTPRVVCDYSGTSKTDDGQASCTVNTGSTSSPYDILQKVSCSRSGQSWTAKKEVASCDYTRGTGGKYNDNPGSSNNTEWATQAVCTFDGTATNKDDLTSCGWDDGISTSGSISTYTVRKTCSYVGTSSLGSTLSSCTAGAASTGTADGTTWSAYTSCLWGSATTRESLSSCSPSGGQSGSNYTGPRVTCANGATTSVADPACVASSPNPPVPLYSSPIVTCAYVADTANAVEVTSCTPSATVACAYGNSTNNPNQASCKPQSMTAVAGTFYGPAKTCAYVPGTATAVTSCDTLPQTPDGTGTYYPARACAYNATWGSWQNVTTGNCEWTNPSSANTYVGPARECQYAVSSTAKVGTCTAVPGSYDGGGGNVTGNQWSVLQKVVCTQDFPQDVGVTNASDVGTCVNSTVNTNPSAGVSQSVVTACAWGSAVTQDISSCTAGGGESPAGTFNTKVECSTTNQDPTPANGVDDRTWVPVAPPCVDTGGVFDVTGKLVECRERDLTVYNADYPSGPVPVASCTPGVASGTQVQTTCYDTTMPMTKPTEPVQSCVSLSPLAPHYVTTTCLTTTTTPAKTMGCTPQSPVAPSWETVTCVDNKDGTKNTLADVAAYYYKSDLRTPALNNCVGAVVPPATSGSVLCSASDPMNNVPTSPADLNAAQHMVTFTLGLGASGYMRYSSSYNSDTSGDFYTVKGNSPYGAADGITADPANGVCAWQSSGLCNWPFPVAAEQPTIDDLWHAGVNGRGAYFSATDAASLTTSISQALNIVKTQAGAASAPALSNPVFKPGDSYAFSGTFKTVDWVGDVLRITVDPISGEPNSTIDWSVQGKLDAKTYSSRSLWTFDAGVATTKLKAFTAANFASHSYFVAPHISSLAQFTCLDPDVCLSTLNQTNASGTNLVNYLRGERTHEGADIDNTKYFRQRTAVLGDIVNAQVVYVSTPYANYADPGYGAFKTAQASRQAVAYAAANDGMLHAFAAKGSAATEAAVLAAAIANAAYKLDPGDSAKKTAADNATAAATTALATDTVVGQELWAFIPTPALPNLYRLADKAYHSKHRYYVDATPAFGDICVSNCTNAATAVWKTILVGGLGRGGRGYYALDITDPANPKALWEFADADLGYTFGMPQIVKRKCEATDTACQSAPWVVLLTSGYNNISNDDGTGGDGVGRLFVLNAETGAQISGISPLSTGAGDVTTPSGLAKITAAVANPSTDATVVGIYGGDLLGNLWRFDINNDVGATGYEAQLFAVLKDGSGKRQPISATPIVSLVKNKYIVMLGTGQLLANSDAAVADPHSLYGLVDRRESGTTASTAIYDNPGGSPRPAVKGLNANGFVMQKHEEVNCPTNAPAYLCAPGDKVLTSSAEAVDYSTNNGWFVDLINSSERANLDPDLQLGTLVFNTNAPSMSACVLGGKTYQYWLDYSTGGAIPAPGTYSIVGKLISQTMASAPKLFVTPQGLRVGTQVGPGDLLVNRPPTMPLPNSTRRTSWRELIAE